MKRKKLKSMALAFPIILILPLVLLSNATESLDSGQPKAEEKDQEFPVVIREPEGALLIDSGEIGPDGEQIMVSCAYCHEERKPEEPIRSAEELEQFHIGLTFTHGTLGCTSCHEPNENEALRLADGTLLERSEVMTLCQQCHGPQARDYNNGSHGGMNGYWDLSRGGRVRNNCVNCHDPHAPAYQMMKPVFPVRDRFISLKDHNTEEDAGDVH